MTRSSMPIRQLEQDWDSDGVSNVDAGNVFRSDLRDQNSRPTNSEVLVAIGEQKVSATTLMNFQYQVGTGGGGGVTITVSGVPTSFTKGGAVSGSISASDGVEPYSFSASGLPNGVTISLSGQLTGTPQQDLFRTKTAHRK